MHIHKIILLTPRDRRQIVGVTLKVLRGWRGEGDEYGQIKMRCCIEGCAFPTPLDVHDSQRCIPANAFVMGGKWAK